MYEIENLGIVSAHHLQSLYYGSHLEKNITKPVWDNIVKTLSEVFPSWTLFTEPMYMVAVDGTNYYFQRNVITIPDSTGITVLGSELFSDFYLGLEDSELRTILECAYEQTGHGMCITNNIIPNVYKDNYLYATTEAIILKSDESFDDYMQTLTSKKRNSIKGSLKCADGFKYQSVCNFTNKETVWILSKLLNNFSNIGVGEDGAFGVEFAQAQWIPMLLNAQLDDYRVYRVLDSDDNLVGFLGYVKRIPIDTECYSGHEVWDFTSFVQDRKYKGVGSAMLIETARSVLESTNAESIAVTLATAPPPGTEFNYFQYKRNCSNAQQEVVNGLATYATAERVFQCSYDSLNKEWK